MPSIRGPPKKCETSEPKSRQVSSPSLRLCSPISHVWTLLGHQDTSPTALRVARCTEPGPQAGVSRCAGTEGLFDLPLSSRILPVGTGKLYRQWMLRRAKWLINVDHVSLQLWTSLGGPLLFEPHGMVVCLPSQYCRGRGY